MGFEVDFMPVGDESKGGDAIALRYGNLFGPRKEQTVVVIDGGYRAAGDMLVEHIEQYYDTDRVDLVISTHPDQDHISGLNVVLEEMRVGELWMHRPWRHTAMMALAKAASFDVSSIGPSLKRSLAGAADLEEVANRRNVMIVEPFTGRQYGALQVLGPTEAYYTQLLLEMPESQSLTASVLEQLEKASRRYLEATVPEDTYTETIDDDAETTARNNSSVITRLDSDGQSLLFTGDAGIPALEAAAGVLETDGFQPGDFALMQVPHHGSRRNVGPSVLNRLLGPKGRTDVGVACVSAPVKNPDNKHPAKKVTNAFRRRGYPAYATQGSKILFQQDAPERWEYQSAAPEVPFHWMVEGDSGT
jgi:beta-lactamase superfamily II metal-dependent hydrolase